jgi:mono/diheme cytochrome c family protein
MRRRPSPRNTNLALRVTALRRFLARLTATIFAVAWLSSSIPAADDAAGREFFEAKIRPVLVEHCFKCHSVEAVPPKSGLRVDSKEGLRRGGENGPAVVPGKPDESLLIQAISHSGEIAAMPPKKKLPDAVVADFRKWVTMGAPDPREPTASASSKTAAQGPWWSLKPITRTPIPKIEDHASRWIRTPIDAFVLAGLREKGLSPAPEADRRTLIRRLSFDLTGLPPTPEETESFLRDDRPEAYELLVERLLSSPHYGERWARHWMDVVHFAETHGHDQDRIRPNAWRYRDYLIESFNRDTPYARFVQEQLAADVLFPGEPRLTVALGFIAAGPWDESSLRDIREDSIDRQIGFYLDRDDMVSTAMSTFVSSTVHCARCHDHKFDPISQADYYSLQAVFAGVDKAERAYDPDPIVDRRRRELTARRKALRERDPKLLESLLEPAVQIDVETWESRQKASPAVWTVLDPDRFESTSGSTFTKESDHSLVAGGAQGAKDTYTITARTNVAPITAVRLEVLPDDRLPSRGPGRAGNGNLHLTEFVLLASQGRPGSSQPVRLQSAIADFEQAGWSIAAAIDGNDQTAWGIYPQVGKPHQAIFELKDDVGGKEGTTLTFLLLQSNPAGHPIGRLRLSVSSTPPPIHVSTLPDAIAAILAVPPSQRSTTQKQDLAAHHLAETLDKQLAELPPQQFVFAGAADFAPDAGHKAPNGPRPVHILRRGDIHQPGTLALAGSLSCIAVLKGRFEIPESANEGARRAALARWITANENPLTWRSIVNRVWHYHFGRGLVDTPNDFGRMGSQPSHPELLDWLAADFRDGGGSLKRLHRTIVTSAAYRQSSGHDTKAAEADADNRWLWRQNRRRLDAESVRDAILLASGRLETKMEGPSIQQFALSPGVHVTPVVDYSKYDWSAADSGRRSVYRFLFRTLPDPFMDCLDAADASQLTPARNESLTPLQALAMLNNRFVLKHAELLAKHLERSKSGQDDQIRLAFALTQGRPPTPDELRDWSAFARKNGLPNACRLLFNSNEFLFVN